MIEDSLLNLSKQILEVAREKKITLSLAESCTGGMASSYITATPGASAYFKGGYIVYSNEMKINILGISPDIIKDYGAVSENTAGAMSRLCLQKTGSRLALAITGIAGPDGGTAAKPVGTVCFAVSSYTGIGKDAYETECRAYRFEGNREQVRFAACEKGLQLVLDKMKSG